MASTSTKVTVGNTTTAILSANEGIRLNASGGSITIDNSNDNQADYMSRYAIAGICASGGKNLCVTEIEK